ncbi:hypothetical protein RUM8411_03216 [Ruegeria meonggei]|uniref:Uncharacterized protein n=1 Tax=Ruegeria meonggei TaxID=1446476 RepID=A0A1X6ZXV0_9RHOB|nr:hypothetical protein RUM8411_03216 [Ruegeria meonggei]
MRKELWKARETAQSSRSLEGRGNKGFVGATSDAIAIPKRRVQQAISRAKGVTQEARNAIRRQLKGRAYF